MRIQQVDNGCTGLHEILHLENSSFQEMHINSGGCGCIEAEVWLMKRTAEDAEGRGSAGKRAASEQAVRRDPGVPWMRHACKILVTDSFTSIILGSRGAVKDEIQEATGARLVFSNRGDHFPDTHFRVLGIYGDDASCILRAFEWVVPRLAELADEERQQPPPNGSDLLGKEPGEIVFRLCITRRMSGQLIGPGGTNIKHIRSVSNAKVYVDNETTMGHRLVRVIGNPAAVTLCLEHVNSYIQREVDREDFFPGYAAIINFGDAARDGWTPPEDTDSWNNGGKGGSWEPTSGWWNNGNLIEQQGDHFEGEAGAPEIASEHVLEDVDALAEILESFPPGTSKLQYSLSFDVPTDWVDSLSEKDSEYIQYVEEATHTQITLDSEDDGSSDSAQPMSVVGPLLNVYTAACMMIQRLRFAELARAQQERAERESEDTDNPVLLKQKIRELQDRLQNAIGTG